MYVLELLYVHSSCNYASEPHNFLAVLLPFTSYTMYGICIISPAAAQLRGFHFLPPGFSAAAVAAAIDMRALDVVKATCISARK